MAEMQGHSLKEQREILVNFVSKELSADLDSRDLDDNEDLLEGGIIDSLGIMKLLAFIEEEFSIRVIDQELTPENFQTINSILHLIETKQAGMND
jgi:acyl carrier protein